MKTKTENYRTIIDIGRHTAVSESAENSTVSTGDMNAAATLSPFQRPMGGGMSKSGTNETFDIAGTNAAILFSLCRAIQRIGYKTISS